MQVPERLRMPNVVPVPPPPRLVVSMVADVANPPDARLLPDDAANGVTCAVADSTPVAVVTCRYVPVRDSVSVAPNATPVLFWTWKRIVFGNTIISPSL